MVDRQAIQACRTIPAFRHLNEGECHQIFEIARERAFAPGEKVIEQGGQSQNLWILLEGKCEVVKQSAHNGSVVLAEFDPHSVFGEMSFFSPAPHSASVIAKTQVRLLSIARGDYDDLIHDGANAAYKLAYNVVESLAGRLRRMDERVTELASEHAEHEQKQANGQPPEWNRFKEKLFGAWNL